MERTERTVKEIVRSRNQGPWPLGEVLGRGTEENSIIALFPGLGNMSALEATNYDPAKHDSCIW